ncbi:MAG: hypothetical protein ACRBHB_11880 [Arenicella sp.]
MKISTIIVASAMSVAATAAIAADDLYKSLDANQDNALSKEEVSIMPGVIKVWEQLDADKDDQLTADEFAKYEEIKLLSKTEPQKAG